MKQSTSLIAGLLVASAMLAPVPALAQQEMSAEQRELMEKVAALGQPGPEHELLARYEGDFELQMKMWMSPGAEPMLVQGTTKGELILGGRFLVLHSTIEQGPFAGEAIQIIGFDRRHEEYTTIGLDSIGTYWVSGQGPIDEGGTRAVLAGTDDDPVIGHTQIYDFVLNFVDADTFVFEVVFKDEMHTQGGPPFLMVQSTATRTEQSDE